MDSRAGNVLPHPSSAAARGLPVSGLRATIPVARFSIKTGLLCPIRTLARQRRNARRRRERTSRPGRQRPSTRLDLPRHWRVDRLRTRPARASASRGPGPWAPALSSKRRRRPQGFGAPAWSYRYDGLRLAKGTDHSFALVPAAGEQLPWHQPQTFVFRLGVEGWEHLWNRAD